MEIFSSSNKEIYSKTKILSDAGSQSEKLSLALTCRIFKLVQLIHVGSLEQSLRQKRVKLKKKT